MLLNFTFTHILSLSRRSFKELLLTPKFIYVWILEGKTVLFLWPCVTGEKKKKMKQIVKSNCKDLFPTHLPKLSSDSTISCLRESREKMNLNAFFFVRERWKLKLFFAANANNCHFYICNQFLLERWFTFWFRDKTRKNNIITLQLASAFVLKTCLFVFLEPKELKSFHTWKKKLTKVSSSWHKNLMTASK